MMGFKLVRKQQYKVTRKQMHDFKKKKQIHELKHRQELKKERRLKIYRLKQRYKLNLYKLKQESKVAGKKRLRRLYTLMQDHKLEEKKKIRRLYKLKQGHKLNMEQMTEDKDTTRLKDTVKDESVKETKKGEKNEERKEKGKTSDKKQYYKNSEYYREDEDISLDGSEYSTSLETLKSSKTDNDNLEYIDEKKGDLKDLQEFIEGKRVDNDEYSKHRAGLSISRDSSLDYLTEEFQYFYDVDDIEYDEIWHDDEIFYTDEEIKEMARDSVLQLGKENELAQRKKDERKKDESLQKIEFSDKIKDERRNKRNTTFIKSKL